MQIARVACILSRRHALLPQTPQDASHSALMIASTIAGRRDCACLHDDVQGQARYDLSARNSKWYASDACATGKLTVRPRAVELLKFILQLPAWMLGLSPLTIALLLLSWLLLVAARVSFPL